MQRDWEDVYTKVFELAPQCSGWRDLIRKFNKEHYHVARSSLQKRMLDDFGIGSWGELAGNQEAPERTSNGADESAYVITRSGMSNGTSVFVTDSHAPFHDNRAVDVAAQIISDIQPDEVVHGGDGQDFYAVSSFDKDPERTLRLQSELDIGFAVNSKLNSAAPDADWYYLDANHEARWQRYLNKNPEISGLRVLELENLLRLRELGWSVGGAERWYVGGLVAFIHGNRYSKHAGWAVKAEMEQRFFQQSIVQGHQHKVGSHIGRGPLRHVEGYEVGCLCSLKPEYQIHPNWNHGMLVMTVTDGRPIFENIMFITRPSGVVALYNGEVYRS